MTTYGSAAAVAPSNCPRPRRDSRAREKAQAATITDLTAQVERLEETVARLTQRNLEVAILAHKWMEAHDKRAAGESYSTPRPVDLPESIARADTLERALATAQERIAEIKECLRSTREMAAERNSDAPQGSAARAILDKASALLHPKPRHD